MVAAEDIKGWLSRGKVEEEKDSKDWAGDKWRMFVKLIQASAHVTPPSRCALGDHCTYPSKGGGDYRGIGFLKTFSGRSYIKDGRFNIIKLHEGSHCFRTGRSILEQPRWRQN